MLYAWGRLSREGEYMRLEKITLNGFKSFADKTDFEFDRDITAIVGPNGCGKSNVVDAVKWVLGNQSPKALRSGHMTDVIFSGSGSRKPSGMAEVNLHFSAVAEMGFENDHLMITRRLYKSGESLYQINNSNCRLKDIRELFMDTGVGVSAYSIIEQGQIDQLLHSSKNDRRLIFEEAAGISKYNSQKKEASRKLDRSEQNLLRLADIVSEVQRQLRSIKLQAGKARNYLEYTKRFKELRVNYSLAEYNKIVTQIEKNQVKLNSGKDRFGAVVAQVGRNDAMLSELATNLIETDARISHCDNSLISVKSKIEQQLERIEFLKSRIKELLERKTNSANHLQKLDDQIDGFTSQITGCQRNLAANETLYTEETGRLDEMQDAISEVNHLYRRIEADLEDEKSGIIDMVRRTAHLHNEIKSISSYRGKMSDQKDRLASRADQTSRQLGDLLTEKAGYSAKLGDIQDVISDLQANLDEKRQQMEEAGEVISRENHELGEIKERRSAVQSEKNILADMEARREGLSKSVKDILQKHAGSEKPGGEYVEGIVADIITADIRYADAIEAALEGRTDAIVINSTRDFLEDENLSQGLDSRVKVICTDRITPFVDTQEVSSCAGVLGRAIEFVKYDQKYTSLAWHLLGKTLLVESIENAMTLSRRLGGDYQFVAVDGTVLDRQGAINVGPVGKTAGLISRKSRLIELTRNLAAISLQISEIDSKLDERNQKNEHLSRLCQNFRTSIYEANTERVDTEAKLSGIKQDVNRLSDEQPLVKSEIETLEKEISQSVQTEHDSRQKLEELESINLERKERIEELEQQFAETRERQDSHLAIMTDLRVSIGQTDEKRKAVKQQITSLESQLQHTRLSLESTRTEMGACDGQVVETERTILAAEAAVSEMFVDKEKNQKESNTLHESVDQLRQKHKETEDMLREKRSEQSQVEQEIHEVELQLSQLSVKDEDLTQRVAEELGIALKEAYQNFEEGEVDWDEVREEISVLRGKIERLGNVNVDAIEEQVELEERYEFLANQVEDLQKSKLQLEQLISRINKESREKFAVTFEQVRLNFQELFRKLFGGGKADIILENPDDILESAIEILAKPPGKETRSISLLSGGEKSMTALALLFAVFKCKPSPFCFLDEVDAALDEANNERFNMIVQEFRKYSQFIIITHAKRTMSIADALFGVTMQTRGVSKKISVQFDRLEDDGDDAAVA